MNDKKKKRKSLENIIIGCAYFLLFTPFILFNFKPWSFSIIILSLLELGSIYLILKGLIKR